MASLQPGGRLLRDASQSAFRIRARPASRPLRIFGPSESRPVVVKRTIAIVPRWDRSEAEALVDFPLAAADLQTVACIKNLMAVRIPEEIKDQFLSALRRGRIRRIVVWSPAIFVISSAAGAAFLIWRGHGLLYLLSRFKPTVLTDNSAPWFWLAALSFIPGL